MKIKYVLLIITFVLSLLFTACQTPPTTPLDALTEFPSRLEGADETKKNSIEILREEAIAGGIVMLYTLPKEQPGEHTLYRTFVAPEGKGWRVQATGWTDYSDTDEFVVTSSVGGNITDLTTVFGISEKGQAVRITWSDGRITILPLDDAAFLVSRQETLTVPRIELLDDAGNVLEMREF